MSEPLPIDPLVPDIVRRLRASSALVLRAPTGAGKTSRVAPALLELGRVLLLEPRRLAARAAARRMAFEQDVRLGSTIGYHVRFDRQAGAATRLLVVTPGILLRLLHDDSALESFDVVVFDEFHERGIDSDLALGMVRLIQQTVRPELRIVVMSATLDTAEAAAYLGDCAVVASEGRLHPVTIRYEPPPKQPIGTSVADAIRRLDATGDVLAFLPGVGEIRQTAGELESWARDHDVLVVPLYGDLPAEQQDIALVPQGRRKIVLATNVAETSITVEGVVAVIDTGLARQLEYDPAVGMDRLKLLPISRASAEQRAGRAGRTGPGICIRLWNEIDQRSRTERTEPEIRRVDLAGPLLQLLALGEGNGFPWLEAPKPAALDQARTLLDRLEATQGGSLTDLGRAMARLPVHPRLARFLLEAARLGCAEHAALAAALLSERDPFLRDTGRGAGPTRSDLIDRAHAVAEYERSGRTSTPLGSLHVAGARFVLRARDQLLRTLRQEADVAETATDDEPTMRALLAAYPDRLARRREGDPRRGVMVGGRGVKLLPASGVVEGELFLCLDVDAGETETLVRQASAVDRDWIDRPR